MSVTTKKKIGFSHILPFYFTKSMNSDGKQYDQYNWCEIFISFPPSHLFINVFFPFSRNSVPCNTKLMSIRQRFFLCFAHYFLQSFGNVCIKSTKPLFIVMVDNLTVLQFNKRLHSGIHRVINIIMISSDFVSSDCMHTSNTLMDNVRHIVKISAIWIFIFLVLCWSFFFALSMRVGVQKAVCTSSLAAHKMLL